MWTKNEVLITKDHAVWILGSLCRFHRIPFDVSLLLQRHPPESNNYYTLSTFLHAVDELGFHHGDSRNEAIDNFASLSLPCLAFKLAKKTLKRLMQKRAIKKSRIYLLMNYQTQTQIMIPLMKMFLLKWLSHY